MPNPKTYSAYETATFETKINTIGYDWKTFNLSQFAWELADSTTYFVRDRAGSVWRLVFTGFGDSRNGLYFFEKEQIFNVGTEEILGSNSAWLLAYPNPSNGQVNILFETNENGPGILRLHDISGKLILEITIPEHQKFQAYTLPTYLNAGIYLISLQHGHSILQQKLIVN